MSALLFAPYFVLDSTSHMMDYWLGSVYPRLMVDPAERMDNLFLLETLHKFFTQLTQLTQSTHSLSVPFDI